MLALRRAAMQRHGARRDQTRWLTQLPDSLGAAVVNDWAPHRRAFACVLRDFCAGPLLNAREQL
jgi:hypothetical protein